MRVPKKIRRLRVLLNIICLTIAGIIALVIGPDRVWSVLLAWLLVSLAGYAGWIIGGKFATEQEVLEVVQRKKAKMKVEAIADTINQKRGAYYLRWLFGVSPLVVDHHIGKLKERGLVLEHEFHAWPPRTKHGNGTELTYSAAR